MHNHEHGVFRECSSQQCLFRFPDFGVDAGFLPCPLCGAETEIVHHIDLLLDERCRTGTSPSSSKLICVLDNIRSVYNVGSIFRTMQGLGVFETYLCGITPTPLHKNFTKTSMGAEQDIHWHSENNAVRVCHSLKADGYFILSLESSAGSKPINQYKQSFQKEKVAFIVGNEITGIDPSILEMSDMIGSIPITGRNKSYNVTVAFGIGLYSILSNG